MAPKVSSRKLKKPKFLKPRMTKNTVQTKDRLQSVNNETFNGVIPVGPRYQADVPSWSNKFQRSIPMSRSGWVLKFGKLNIQPQPQLKKTMLILEREVKLVKL
ncbi:hypothetical protein AgCh_039150 [Apium graveolens]